MNYVPPFLTWLIGTVAYFALILLIFILVGCGQPPTNSPSTSMPMMTPTGSISVFVDPASGCEYLFYGAYNVGAALTPRNNPNGTQICNPAGLTTPQP